MYILNKVEHNMLERSARDPVCRDAKEGHEVGTGPPVNTQVDLAGE